MTASHESIQTVDNLLAYFREELVRAFEEVDWEASEETEAYLVHLLKGFTRLEPNSAEEVGFDKPAAFYLGEAMNSPGDRRVEVYRRLGDASLFNCGFFDAYLARGLVNTSYYQGVGRLAYEKLSHLHKARRPAGPFETVFEELASNFDDVVAALQWVGRSLEQSDAMSPPGSDIEPLDVQHEDDDETTPEAYRSLQRAGGVAPPDEDDET